MENLWEEHLRYEFSPPDKSTELTMATMVDEPYVNHVPTMIGGVGKALLAHFYQNHFIHSNPPMQLSPVSRTIGHMQIVDEMVVSFTHTSHVDWLVPGAAPTNRTVLLPLVAIVRFAEAEETAAAPTLPDNAAAAPGEPRLRIAHEHIYWDQASVLLQLGLLPAGLARSLDVTGAEQAAKVLDPQAVPSNELLARAGRLAEQRPQGGDGGGPPMPLGKDRRSRAVEEGAAVDL